MLLNKIGKLGSVALVLMSASTLASTTTANFGSVSDIGHTFDRFSVVSGGVTINVSGWADTSSDLSDGINSNGNDDKIERTRDLDKHSGGGWSMQNIDEQNEFGNKSTNGGTRHSADNSKGGSQDYDTFLLEFSHSVNLSSATSSWLQGQDINGSNSSRITAAANNQITVAALSSNNISGKTWSDVKNNQTLKSGYSGFGNFSIGTGYYTSNLTTTAANVSGTYSKFWLIGALNSVFSVIDTSGLEGNDGFKLASVNFSTAPPVTSVAEPSTIAIFGLALMGLFAANRRKIK